MQAHGAPDADCFSVAISGTAEAFRGHAENASGFGYRQ